MKKNIHTNLSFLVVPYLYPSLVYGERKFLHIRVLIHRVNSMMLVGKESVFDACLSLLIRIQVNTMFFSALFFLLEKLVC